MSYLYWDSFVYHWCIQPTSFFNSITPPLPKILGWTNPNITPNTNKKTKSQISTLLNDSSNPNDYSLKYLPEPWWGNNGEGELNSVVINYNPWKGGDNQLYTIVPNLLNINSYPNLVSNHVLNRNLISTNNWHKNKRANPIYKALLALNIPNLITNTPHNPLLNHLSIELIPWHTDGVNTTTFKDYINANLDVIYEHCILFAACQSRRIANDKLKNKVILKICERKTNELFKNLKSNCTITGYQQYPIPPNQRNKSMCQKFTIDDIPDIEFISIWEARKRNNLPSVDDLKYIFKNFI